jgi:putative colanic acid biosynthesis acetyltransferase WcaB
MKLFEDLKADLAVNRGNPKGATIVFAFRVAAWVRSWPGPLWILGSPYLLAYLVVVVWILGIELGYRTRIGKGLALHHGVGLVVNEQAVLGEFCVLRHCTTIGNKAADGGCPTIGNHVDIGSNAVILGEIAIGDHARIGAGTVVVGDIPAGVTAVGNPARIIASRSIS